MKKQKIYNNDFLIEVIGILGKRGTFIQFLIKNTDINSQVRYSPFEIKHEWLKCMEKKAKQAIKIIQEKKLKEKEGKKEILKIEKKLEELKKTITMPSLPFLIKENILLKTKGMLKFNKPIYDKKGDYDSEQIFFLFKKSSKIKSQILAWLLEAADETNTVAGNPEAMLKAFHEYLDLEAKKEITGIKNIKKRLLQDNWEIKINQTKIKAQKGKCKLEYLRMCLREFKKHKLASDAGTRSKIILRPDFFA